MLMVLVPVSQSFVVLSVVVAAMGVVVMILTSGCVGVVAAAAAMHFGMTIG